MVIHWQDWCGKGIRESFIRTQSEKVPNWECFFVNREKGIFLSVYVDDMKLARKKQNIDHMWKVLMRHVDLGEPTSFLDHDYLGCSQRDCATNHNVVDNSRSMYESRISAGATENFLAQGDLMRTYLHGLRHGRPCQEMCGTVL